MTKQFKLHKDFIIKELAKLERMNWTADKKISASIFPYVLIEAINILKNSEIVENPVDYMGDTQSMEATMEEILNSNQ